MNINTAVLEPSARMSSSIHHKTDLSTLSGVNFDKLFNSKKLSAQQSHQNQQLKALQLANSRQTHTASMESNLLINVARKTGNLRRHSLVTSIRDERLLKVLSAPPDEPLYIDDNHAQRIGDSFGSTSNLLKRFESVATATRGTATSSNGGVDDYENLPPSDEFIVNHNEDDDNPSTPQKYFSNAVWNKIQRDLNSPSASCRLRALRAIKSPTGDHFYNTFDVPHEEQDIITEVDRQAIEPKSLVEVMKDVVIYVEVRSSTDNRTAGIKSHISALGIKVNDKLLRNTTHVIFKDGLQSTYNKAKTWQIPLVSILWMEACKKHQVVMDTKDFPISNIYKYENPELFPKMKVVRSKFIISDVVKSPAKTPTRKTAVPKLLNGNANAKIYASRLSLSASTSVSIQATNQNASANKKPSSRKSLAASTSKPSRKTISFIDEKPKNTIVSMFMKKMAKTKEESGQAATTSNDSVDVIESTPTKADEGILQPGGLHKRLTRRNSITLQTPTKTNAQSVDSMNNESVHPSTPSSVKRRRCTMFTPSARTESIEEEQDSSPTEKGSKLENKTINESRPMEICGDPKQSEGIAKFNNKTRQMILNGLPKTPAASFQTSLNGNMRSTSELSSTQRSSILRRRTLYTPQPMDETNVLNGDVTPTNRRKTMNFNETKSPTFMPENPSELNDSTSCDAILMPSNSKLADKSLDTSMSSLVSTPLIKSMSQMNLDLIRKSTSKSLYDEYENTFSSKKTPLVGKRRTISNITMDIIKQRIENINRNASFKRSTEGLNNDSPYSHLLEGKKTNDECDKKSPEVAENAAKTSTVAAKPLKRKLFVPPSMSMDYSPMLSFATPPKTDKKTAPKSLQKRKRNATPDHEEQPSNKQSEDAKKPIRSVKEVSKKKPTSSRRSTMFFETPISKSKPIAKTVTNQVSAPSTVPKSNGVMVFTSMHQPQINYINEAVKKLGGFEIEDKVTAQTTHLVSFDTRRTINLLRGVIRGVWILDYDWIVKSVEANEWQPESPFELKSFSKAIEMCRIERQAFGKTYRLDIFRNFEPFYVAPKCACKDLRELIVSCHGKVVKNHETAKYIIGERHRPNIDATKSLQVHANWILDSISMGKVKNTKNYLLTVDKSN